METSERIGARAPRGLRARRAFGIVLFVAVASAFGLEIGARWLLRSRGTPYEVAAARARLEDLRDVDQRALFAPELASGDSGAAVEGERDPTELLLHPFLGFAPRGKTQQMSAELRQGVRRSPDGPYEILILGGSVAGMFNALGADRMVELLRDDPRFSGRELRCVPFSTGGYKQPQQSIRLLELLHHGYEPDAVLEIDGYNELALGSANASSGTNPYYPSAEHWTHLIQAGAGDPRLLDEAVAIRELRSSIEAGASRSLALGLYRSCVLGRLVLARLERLRAREVEHFQRYSELVAERTDPVVLHGPEFASDADATVEEIARTWSEASRCMHDLCAARGIYYVHVLQPALHDEGSKPLTERERAAGASAPAKIEGVRRGYPLLREAGAELRARGVLFIDASDLFAHEAQTRYRDPCHFDRRGCEMLAERIAPAFLAGLAQ